MSLATIGEARPAVGHQRPRSLSTVQGVDCSFSEFSYGYAAIREAESELTQAYQATGAPILPSLVEEEHLGYDAKLRFVEYALFLQFKRVQYVSRRHPALPTWPHVGGPHHRYAIDTDGHQHQALLELELRLWSGAEVGEVYYAAPTFHREHEFDEYYSRGQVLRRSSLVSPSEFGLDDGTHHLVVDEFGASLMLSSPRPPKRQAWERLVADVYRRGSNETDGHSRERVSLGFPEEALMSSVAILGRGRNLRRDAPPIRRIQRLAALLDCGLILFTAPVPEG